MLHLISFLGFGLPIVFGKIAHDGQLRIGQSEWNESQKKAETEYQLAEKDKEISRLKDEIINLKSKLSDCRKQAKPEEDESKLEPWKGWSNTKY